MRSQDDAAAGGGAGGQPAQASAAGATAGGPRQGDRAATVRQPQAEEDTVRTPKRAPRPEWEEREARRGRVDGGGWQARPAGGQTVAGANAAPGVEVREERPEPEQCRCPRCGARYGRHRTVISALHEIEVKAHTRRIRRLRYRPMRQCSEARKALAAPVPRLFAGTPYGISVWSWHLVQVYALYRPQRAAALELGLLGLEVAAGTLTGHLKRAYLASS